MAIGLSRLQEIKVSDCDALDGIVAKKNIKDDGVHINGGVCEEIVEFAQMRKLTLSGLPKLKNFVSNGEIQNKRQKSLQESEIHTEEEDDEEGVLKSSLPFFTKVSCPKLEELQINKCNSLKYMLTPYIATGLVRLRSLKVSDCAGMKHLVVEEEKGETNIKTIIFPQLSSIRLNNLPNLTTFYSEIGLNENIDTPTQPLFNEKISFPKLEKLVLSKIPNLTEIWSHRFQEISFCNLTSVEVGNCNVLKRLFYFSMAIGLSRLQEIKVSDCDALDGIVAKKNIKDDGVHINNGVCEEIVEFAQMRKLTLSGLPKLKNFVSNGEIQNKRQKSLQESEIHTEEDDDEEGVLKSSLPFFTKVSFFKLEELVLSEIPNLTEIWSHGFQEISLCNLTTMKVGHCNVLKSVSSFSMATGLSRLQEMEVSDCDALEAIVTEKNVNDDGVNNGVREEIVEFAQLRKLTLSGLPKLKNFISNGEIQNKRQNSLQESEIHTEEEEDEEGELKSFLPFFTKVSFPKLQKLELSAISSLKYLLTPSIATSLVGLESLEVKGCAEMKHLVVAEEEEEINIGTITFPQLSSLCLEELPNLTTFYSVIGSNDTATQSPFSEKVSFPRLEKLELSGISSFKYLLTPSVVMGLVALESLKVKDCAGMKHLVVAEEEGETNTDALSFPQLRSLCLKELPNLTSIYLEMSSNENIDTATQPLYSVKVSFPRLEKLKLFGISSLKYLLTPSIATSLVGLKSLTVKGCAEMKHLVVAEEEGETNIETITFPQLSSLCLKKLPNLTTFYSVIGSNDTTTQSLFSEKVSCPRLEKLELSGISSFKYLLTPSVVMSLVALESLKVKDCVRMKHLVVAEEEGETNIETITFPQLSSLCLEELSNLTTFYLVMGSNDTATQPLISEKVSFPKLKKLELLKISNLTEIWSHKFQEISCCNLTTLTINTCKSLKHVFPAYVARSTNKLEYLIVKDCEVIETIIGDENHKEEIIKATQHEHVTATFMFAKLTMLRLQSLPKVKCFYPRKHTIECPLLGSLNVKDCGNLSILDLLSFPPKEGDDQFEKVMSNLKYMSIRSTDLEKIRDLYCNFPPHLFSSLERLTIVGSGVFPSEFLGIIHNQLKRFAIYNCSFQEIFPYEREFTNHAVDHTLFLPKLKRLSLKKLPQLNYICKHDHKKSLILNILGRIEFLHVEECPRLTNLVQPSTARSLENLRMLTISGCEMMEKIIGDDDDDDDGYDDEESSRDDHEIIFPNLRRLRLSKLPMLKNFCSSLNYTFNFPKLNIVKVRECPNMKTFCVGITTTPNLKKVEYEHDQERWEGGLNTTVQKVFAEMEAKRLGISLPSTLSSNHVEAKAHALENSSEELTDPIPTVVQIRQNQGKEPEVYENSIETETFKAIVPYTREKGKGKEPEVSVEVMEHSNPSTHIYTAREQTVAGSVASSSKASSHSEEFHERLIPSTSSSSNNQEAEIHDQTAEPTKEPQICKHVVDEISEQGTFTENAIEPRVATEISEDSAEKSVKLEVRELAPLLPSTSSTNYIEAAQVPENSAKAQNDATNVDKMADTFEKGSQASSEETNPPVQTSLSHSTELEVRGSTSTVESEATDPKKGSEIDEEVLQGVKLPDISDRALPSQLHPQISNTLQETSQQKDSQELRVTKHFIPLMSKVLEILQTRPLNRMRPEHVKFMEDASRELSHMNFPMDWLCPYLVKANNCLSVVERTNAISKVELKIAEVESQLQALQESKRSLEETKKAMEEENKVIAFSMVLDKPLYEE